MQKNSMKAAYLTGLHQMEIREVPGPLPPGDNDVLLRIDTVGVCGSDIHYYKQGRVGTQRVEYPHVIGHECAATIVEMGRQVREFMIGQRVAIDPLVPCGRCDQCLAGRKHTCREQKFLGNPGQMPGALAEYVVLPSECCTAVPDTLDNDQAAAVEPFSIGLYAARMAQLATNARVGIIGSGPIGLCTLLAIRAITQATVYVTDLLDERLAVARICGAEWTGNPCQQEIVKSLGQIEPLGLDAVFECAGEQAAIDQGLELLKPGGALLIIGIPEVYRISLDINLMRRNELRVLNVRRQNECVAPAVEMIASGRVDIRPIVTHHFPLDQAPRAFELVAAREDGVLKAMIDVSSWA